MADGTAVQFIGNHHQISITQFLILDQHTLIYNFNIQYDVLNFLKFSPGSYRETKVEASNPSLLSIQLFKHSLSINHLSGLAESEITLLSQQAYSLIIKKMLMTVCKNIGKIYENTQERLALQT